MEKGEYSSHDVGTNDFLIILEDIVISLPWDIKKKKKVPGGLQNIFFLIFEQNYQSVRKD